LSKSRGKVHDYLGMILDFSVKGELTINMIPYVKMVLDSIPRDMMGRAATPAASYLYQVSEIDPVPLDAKTADAFHSHVMQLLYLAQRGRPDILEAVSFLTSRVQPDADDYKKLARVMKYLQSSVSLVLRLSSSGDGILHWWVDASYAVHPNMKGHTGGTMSMGKGSVYSMSRSQKEYPAVQHNVSWSGCTMFCHKWNGRSCFCRRRAMMFLTLSCIKTTGAQCC
jgi:hypothetical protein